MLILLFYVRIERFSHLYICAYVLVRRGTCYCCVLLIRLILARCYYYSEPRYWPEAVSHIYLSGERESAADNRPVYADASWIIVLIIRISWVSYLQTMVAFWLSPKISSAIHAKIRNLDGYSISRSWSMKLLLKNLLHALFIILASWLLQSAIIWDSAIAVLK